MEIIIEKLKKEDLKEAISIYDNNYNLKTNYEMINYNSSHTNYFTIKFYYNIMIVWIIINFVIFLK